MSAEELAARALAGRDKVHIDVDEIVTRLWRARREIYNKHLIHLGEPDAPDVYVGEDFWYSLQAVKAEPPTLGAVSRRMVEVRNHEPEWGVFVLGCRVRFDPKLEPRAIVLRAEVSA